MAHDLDELEAKVNRLKWDYEQHLEKAKKLEQCLKEQEKRLLEIEKLIHTGHSLVVAVRVVLIGMAILAVSASHGFWASILRFFGSGK